MKSPIRDYDEKSGLLIDSCIFGGIQKAQFVCGWVFDVAGVIHWTECVFSGFVADGYFGVPMLAPVAFIIEITDLIKTSDLSGDFA